MSDILYDYAELSKAVYEMRDKLKSVTTDFANYKKRVKKEKENFQKYQDEHLLTHLIPAIDNLWHCYKNSDKDSDVSICAKTFFAGLESAGITIYEPIPDMPFDTSYMNAVISVEINNFSKIGKVEKCISPGYAIGDKIIKYAAVSVYI